MFEMINGKGVQIHETDETLIQFKMFWLEKISDDYDPEYGMTVAWTMTMAMTSIRRDTKVSNCST